MNRDRSIDSFRGLAIIGMVFFTLTLRLSADLPDFLQHNVRGSFHMGDLVLPMFLFASGLSLPFYLEKVKGKRALKERGHSSTERDSNRKPVFSIAKRFGMLAIVSVLLSHFSARGLLEMDEVMLIALLVCPRPFSIGPFSFLKKTVHIFQIEALENHLALVLQKF